MKFVMLFSILLLSETIFAGNKNSTLGRAIQRMREKQIREVEVKVTNKRTKKSRLHKFKPLGYAKSLKIPLPESSTEMFVAGKPSEGGLEIVVILKIGNNVINSIFECLWGKKQVFLTAVSDGKVNTLDKKITQSKKGTLNIVKVICPNKKF